MRAPHPFAGNPLDRGERERRDEAWIHRAETAAGSRYLPFRNLDVLINDRLPPRLGWLNAQRIRTFATGAEPIFLGLLVRVAHFAVDMSPFPEAAARVADGRGWRFEDCRTAGTVLAGRETGILAQARSLLHWHARHGFCSACGQPTVARRGGQVRQCSACEVQHFPRTAPVVITVVGDPVTDR